MFKKNAGDHITTLNHDLKGHQVLRSPHRVRCSIALFHPQIGLCKDSTGTPPIPVTQMESQCMQDSEEGCQMRTVSHPSQFNLIYEKYLNNSSALKEANELLKAALSKGKRAAVSL